MCRNEFCDLEWLVDYSNMMNRLNGKEAGDAVSMLSGAIVEQKKRSAVLCDRIAESDKRLSELKRRLETDAKAVAGDINEIKSRAEKLESPVQKN